MRRPVLALWLIVAACFTAACGAGEEAAADDGAPAPAPTAPTDTPPAVPAPRIESFSASVSEVTAGRDVLLTAKFDDAHGEVAVITPGDLAVKSGVAVSTGALAATTEFTLTVTSTSGEQVHATVDVKVVPAPSITSFSAASDAVRRGGETTITPVFCDQCTGVVVGLGPVESGVPITTGALAADVTFTLEVTSSLGEKATATTSVKVFDGASCLDVKLAQPTAADGPYALRPRGAQIQSVYCDMTTDGGGWTKVLHTESGVYAPVVGGTGNVSVAMGPFAKLADADVSLSAVDWIFRIVGSQSDKAVYIDTAAAFDDTAKAMGLLAEGTHRACVADTLAGCDLAPTTGDTIDTLAWGMTADTCDRFVADATGQGPYCSATSSSLERCFVRGASCAAGNPVSEQLAVWVRESYRDAVVRSKPAAYFRLDEASGAIRDEVGGLESTSHADLSYGAPGLVAREGLTFTANGYAEFAYAAALNPAEFSVEMWLDYTGREGYNRSPITSRDTNLGYFFYVLPSNALAFRVGTGTTYKGIEGPVLVKGQRYHVVGTYGAGMLSLYVDGVAIGPGLATTFAPNTSKPMRLGAGSTEGPANNALFHYGHLDEVAIYDRPLDPAEVARHHAVGVLGAGVQPAP